MQNRCFCITDTVKQTNPFHFCQKQHWIHELETLIEEMFFSGKLSFNDEVYITNIRQKNALAEAQNSLKMVLQSIADGMPEDFFTIDMMNAYEALGTIIGESVGEDLVNEIFSKFCMVLVLSVGFMMLTAVVSVLCSVLPGFVPFRLEDMMYLFEKCMEIGILLAFAMLPILALGNSGEVAM